MYNGDLVLERTTPIWVKWRLIIQKLPVPLSPHSLATLPEVMSCITFLFRACHIINSLNKKYNQLLRAVWVNTEMRHSKSSLLDLVSGERSRELLVVNWWTYLGLWSLSTRFKSAVMYLIGDLTLQFADVNLVCSSWEWKRPKDYLSAPESQTQNGTDFFEGPFLRIIFGRIAQMTEQVSMRCI